MLMNSPIIPNVSMSGPSTGVGLNSLTKAKKTSTAVRLQMKKRDTNEPIASVRWNPKVNLEFAGRCAMYTAIIEIRNPEISLNKWAASVMMASEDAK